MLLDANLSSTTSHWYGLTVVDEVTDRLRNAPHVLARRLLILERRNVLRQVILSILLVLAQDHIVSVLLHIFFYYKQRRKERCFSK
jgi:hypothetical protein